MASRRSFGGYEEERFENTVESRLLCPICRNVLKDPVQCPNEHYFCRSCVGEHLRKNSKTCPMCQHHLTEETLTKPPRILTDMLLSLKIRCDHAKRGCRELIKLEFLDRHVKRCGYSPTRCTNPGCSEVINQHEQERHENELCRFRMTVCNDCKQQVLRKSSRVHPCFMRKEMDDLARKMEKDMREVKDEVKQVKLTQEEFIRNLMVQVNKQNDVVEDLCHKMNDMRAEMEITKEASERCDLFTGRQKIFVCGGRDDKYNLNSVESFNWPENSWTLEPAMKKGRTAPAAFVHERQIYVTGGWTETEYSDSIGSLNVDEENMEWIVAPVKMPIKCRAHTMVCHENSAILTGGRTDGDSVSDGIYEIKLNPPYTTKLLTQMPEPRCHHGCHIIDNQVVVVGGTTSKYHKDAKNTVYAYDMNSNEYKTLPSLPYPISAMATVSYKGNVILIGGVNEKAQTLNSVVMYDVKTGKIKMLPRLNHKRAASAAVITGNVMIVMGGYDYETKTYLKSVEYFDFSTNVWKELSPMKTVRSFATAVLKPIS